MLLHNQHYYMKFSHCDTPIKHQVLYLFLEFSDVCLPLISLKTECNTACPHGLYKKKL